MKFSQAIISDIPQVEQLQQRYHVSTISDQDRPDGFVTTLFTRGQFEDLIKQENGLFIAKDQDKVIAYAMAASWQFWSQWPLFEYMIEHLYEDRYLGQVLSVDNSYQYGPVCIDKAYRGQGILQGLFEFHRREMQKRFPIMITFINHNNPRSYAAHTRKVGLDLIKSFDFNDQHYYELAYDLSQPLDIPYQL